MPLLQQMFCGGNEMQYKTITLGGPTRTYPSTCHFLTPSCFFFLYCFFQATDQPVKPFAMDHESMYILISDLCPLPTKWAVTSTTWSGAHSKYFFFISVFQGHPWVGLQCKILFSVHTNLLSWPISIWIIGVFLFCQLDVRNDPRGQGCELRERNQCKRGRWHGFLIPGALWSCSSSIWDAPLCLAVASQTLWLGTSDTTRLIVGSSAPWSSDVPWLDVLSLSGISSRSKVWMCPCGFNGV